MLRLQGSIAAGPSVPNFVLPPQIRAAPVLQVESGSLSDLTRLQVAPELPGQRAFLTSSELQELKTVLPNGGNIFVPSNPQFGDDRITADKMLLYETLCMTRQTQKEGVQLGVNGVAKCFRDFPQKQNANIVFEGPAYGVARGRLHADISRLRDKVDVADSDEPCVKCKSKKVQTVRKQTRSGDEGGTTIHLCSSCGHQRWVRA